MTVIQRDEPAKNAIETMHADPMGDAFEATELQGLDAMQEEAAAMTHPQNWSLMGEHWAGLYAASKAANAAEAADMTRTLMGAMDEDEAVHTIGAVMNDYKKIHAVRMYLFAAVAFGMGILVSKMTPEKTEKPQKAKTEQGARLATP